MKSNFLAILPALLFAAALAGSPAPGATPVLWLDASNGASITKDAGNKVSLWSDSGSGGGPTHASQSTAAKQPTLIAGALNGLPVMDFGPFGSNADGQQMAFDAQVTTVRSVVCVVRGANFILGDDNVYHFHRGGDTATSTIWSNTYASSNIRSGQTYLDGVLVNGTQTPLADGFSTEFSGTIGGSGGLTKTGSGTWTLAGANTFSGPLTVLGGSLRLAQVSSSNPGSPAGTPTFWLDASNAATITKDASNMVRK